MQFENMSAAELRAKLAEYEELLEDYLDEREMLLGQTGQHISSTGIAKKYEALEKEAKNAITEIKRLISERA